MATRMKETDKEIRPTRDMTPAELTTEVQDIWAAIRKLQKEVTNGFKRHEKYICELRRDKMDIPDERTSQTREVRCVWCNDTYPVIDDDDIKAHGEACAVHPVRIRKQRIDDLERENQILNRENQTYRELLGQVTKPVAAELAR